MTPKILKRFYSEKKKNDATSVVQAAAKLISEELRMCDSFKKSDYYPTFDTEDFKDKLTSDSETIPLLLGFLKTIITAKSHREERLVSIIHSIVHANRPRSTLPSLQLGLAVQLHHTEGSRRIIEQLYRMGFCASYTDVSVNFVVISFT